MLNSSTTGCKEIHNVRNVDKCLRKSKHEYLRVITQQENVDKSALKVINHYNDEFIKFNNLKNSS